jgi:hypothetical protein
MRLDGWVPVRFLAHPVTKFAANLHEPGSQPAFELAHFCGGAPERQILKRVFSFESQSRPPQKGSDVVNFFCSTARRKG